MTIPDYQTLMLPLLRCVSDGQEHSLRDAVDQLATEFTLSESERTELLPSGSALLFNNRVSWARTYMRCAGLIKPGKRGMFCITAEGRALLARNPSRVDNTTLNQYESFREWRTRGKDSEPNLVGS